MTPTDGKISHLFFFATQPGICYVETMNIDGETNLKIRNARKDIMNLCIT